MLHSNSALKNVSFDLGSNSGDKDEGRDDILLNYDSSIKFKKRPRMLFGDYEDKSLKNNMMVPFNETENTQFQKGYEHPKSEVFDALAKVKQSQASKNIIK